MTSSIAIASAFYKAFPGTEHLIVEEIETCGCGQKFNLYAGSTAFDGVKILDRHRQVNEALATGPFFTTFSFCFGSYLPVMPSPLFPHLDTYRDRQASRHRPEALDS